MRCTIPIVSARAVIASEAKEEWIASRSLSSGAHSRDPLARNDENKNAPDRRARFRWSVSLHAA
jgi:hypothetical protein